MLFNSLYFVGLPVGQVNPKNNLPEAILACIGQALISNPEFVPKTTGPLQLWRSVAQLLIYVNLKEKNSKLSVDRSH